MLSGLNIGNKIKYMYYSFSITKLKKSKEKSLNLESYIKRIFTPESITLHYTKIMMQKAFPSVLLHKSEVTYIQKQGRKRPLDMAKWMIERRDRER